MREKANTPYAIEDCWPSLGNSDRLTSFTARTIIENHPTDKWLDRLLNEAEPRVTLNALLVLARVGAQDDQVPLLKALTKFPLDSLDDELKLLKLRVIKVSFARQGRPAEELVKLGVEKLNRQYPAKTFALNRELSELLIWLTNPQLGAAGAVGTALRAVPDEDAKQDGAN